MSNNDWEPDPQIVAVVDKKMVEVKRQFLDKMNNPDVVDGDPKRVYVGVSHDKARQMLRLDWELNTEVMPDASNELIVDLILTQMSVDFYDILENGDSSTNYPLLSLFDGKKKVGKDLADIELGDIAIYKEWIPNKKSVEYTIYTRLSPVWA